MRHADPPASASRTVRQEAGAQAEDAASAHLQRHGCQILARNVRYREGELDIVARQGSTILFVEVRMRRSERFGGAVASVDAAKRQRLLRAAQHYLLQTLGNGARTPWPACRFDVMAVDRAGACEWIQGAFSES